ncbi:MAG TPA: A/G-specific adenine glycosylase [Bacteroidia bacterium]|nr:A/G-specific adenine glycosylase [Bacteroidia bacterium]
MTQVSDKLINWYEEHKRDLPWRNTKNPYFIWLSEIILQQTRVDQGMAYYLKFAAAFPTVKHLAEADNEKVMKLWQGLGYYSRARNLHATAQLIIKNYGGIFPNSYEDILALKGIGTYTAAAIASFAYDLPYAVVDGNVYRVLSRVFGIATPIDSVGGKKEFNQLANEIINKKKTALHNQAIMEFGAMHCKPVNPDCESCILRSICQAASTRQVDKLPVKEKKTKIRNRYFNYIVLRHKNKIILQKRLEKDIWTNLYDFPLIETTAEIQEEAFLQLKEWQTVMGTTPYKIHSVSSYYKHVLSHQKIYARFWEIHCETQPDELVTGTRILVPTKNLSKYAVPRLIENYLAVS